MISYARVDHHDRDWVIFLPILFSQTDRLRRAWGEVTIWHQLGWFRGPHALVGFSSAAELSATKRKEAESALSAAAQASPSIATLDEQQWLEFSHASAREDLIEGPFLPLEADNRVTWVSAENARMYLEPNAAETMGLLLSYGERIGLDMLTASTEVRNDWAFTGMVVLADEYRGGGAARGYLSYLSHWKEFLWWQPAGDRIEARWAEAYERQREALTSRVMSVLKRTRYDVTADGWRTWASAALGAAEDLARSGSIGVVRPESWLERASAIDASTRSRWEFTDQRGYSDFHTQFRLLDTTKFELEHEFASYRFVESVQFRLFAFAGVGALDRCALAYLFSRAVEDALLTDWRTIVHGGIVSQQRAKSEFGAIRRRGAEK